MSSRGLAYTAVALCLEVCQQTASPGPPLLEQRSPLYSLGSFTLLTMGVQVPSADPGFCEKLWWC